MSGYNKAFGFYGEALAANYLQNKGYIIIDRNYRTPYGEIDIVCRDGATTVFVEVKTRSSSRFGSGLEAIGEKKQRTMLKCAEYYAQTAGAGELLRIDALAIDTSKNEYTHIKGAIE